MEKTIMINLGGSVFYIEEEAYAKLRAYLDDVSSRLDENDGAEVLADIEAALAEKILSRAKGNSPLTALDVDKLISEMGQPSDFGNLREESTSEGKRESQRNEGDESIKRRLYRSNDDVVIAGVCSGVANYLDLDPVIVRVLFVLLLFLNGFGLLAYLVLWIAVPEAKTTAQKLEMRGEAINIGNLAEAARDKVRERGPEIQSGFRRVLALPFELLGRFFMALKNIFSKLLPLMVSMSGLFMLLACAFALAIGTFIVVALGLNIDNANLHIDQSFQVLRSGASFYALLISGYLLFFVPLVFLTQAAVSLLRRRNSFRLASSAILFALWVIAASFFGALMIKSMPEFQALEEKRRAEASHEKILSLKEFNALRLSGDISVEYQPGPLSAKAIGRSADLDKINLANDASALMVRLDDIKHPGFCFLDCYHPKVRLLLSSPDLKSVELDDTSDLVIEGDYGDLSLMLSGVSSAELKGTADRLRVDLSDGTDLRSDLTASSVSVTVADGAQADFEFDKPIVDLSAKLSDSSMIIVSGKASTTKVELMDNAEFRGKKLEAYVADIQATDASAAKIRVEHKLSAKAEDGASIYYYEGTEEVEKSGDVRMIGLSSRDDIESGY